MNITKQHPVLEKYYALLSTQGKSSKTIKTYVTHVYYFLLGVPQLSSSECMHYFDALSRRVQAREISRSHYNQAYYSVKYFFEGICHWEMPRTIKHYEVPVVPPQIIPVDKFVEAYNMTESVKERCCLGLLCISMLRKEECQLIQIKNIDFRQKIVYVYLGKGAKHRVTILGESTASDIEEYLRIRLEKNNPYLFNAYMSQTRYVSKSWIHRVVYEAGVRVKCDNWHPHLLRHSGASYLDQADTSTRKIQELLGHSKLTTTERYLHPGRSIIEVRSPLDTMLLHNSVSIEHKG
jgi:integrase/recombinase XerD